MKMMKSFCKFSKALLAIGVLLLIAGAFFCKSSYNADAAPQKASNPVETHEKKEEVKQESDFPFPIVDDSPEQNIRIQQRSIKKRLVRIQKRLEKRKERKKNVVIRKSK